jgi:hypothetical protein
MKLADLSVSKPPSTVALQLSFQRPKILGAHLGFTRHDFVARAVVTYGSAERDVNIQRQAL